MQDASEGELQECDEAFLAPDYESLTDQALPDDALHTPNNDENDVDDETTMADNDVERHYQETMQQQRQAAAGGSGYGDTTFEEYPDYSSSDSILDTGEFSEISNGGGEARAVDMHHQDFPESLRLEGRAENLRSLQRDDRPQTYHPWNSTSSSATFPLTSSQQQRQLYTGTDDYNSPSGQQYPHRFAPTGNHGFTSSIGSGNNLWKIVAFKPEINSKNGNANSSGSPSALTFNSVTLENGSGFAGAGSGSCNNFNNIGLSVSGMGNSRSTRKLPTLDCSSSGRNVICTGASKLTEDRSSTSNRNSNSKGNFSVVGTSSMRSSRCTPVRSFGNESVSVRPSSNSGNSSLENLKNSAATRVSPASTSIDVRPTSSRSQSSTGSHGVNNVTNEVSVSKSNKNVNASQSRSNRGSTNLDYINATLTLSDPTSPKADHIASDINACIRR